MGRGYVFVVHLLHLAKNKAESEDRVFHTIVAGS
jgi:hypothetical protein